MADFTILDEMIQEMRERQRSRQSVKPVNPGATVDDLVSQLRAPIKTTPLNFQEPTVDELVTQLNNRKTQNNTSDKG